MLKINFLTVFPEMFESVRAHSMWGRAAQKGLLDLNVHNIREYSADKHRRTDDYPFGGGVGLVMTAQPVADATRAVGGGRRIYLSPRGRVLTHQLAVELAAEAELTLLCGHYEGVDQRALDLCGYEEISIGDYVLTGGELPAMVLADAVMRHIPGVLGSEESAAEESHANGLLEYPQYTRPAIFEGMEAPEVLLSGHHANIVAWREAQMLAWTKKNRPDLLGE